MDVQHEFVERIVAAEDRAAIEAACGLLRERGHEDRQQAGETFQREIARALYLHLKRLWPHARFQVWLDGYFGLRPANFRSALQQPSFLYYPVLEPKPWFRTEDVPQLRRVAPQIPAVQEEIRTYLGLQPGGFAPYVSSEASQSTMWRPLAGQQAWSALHLIRRNEWMGEHLSYLPATLDFLNEVPLAICPPHAPECFISRLQPGTVLPPHFGLSNIKLTTHLAIELPPEGCSITVANVSRTWPQNDFLIFDDSFLHTASNRAGSARVVLILDVWHPHLDDTERAAFAYSIDVLDQVRRATGA